MHTSTPQFTTGFEAIEKRFELDNDQRAERIEEYLIAEAVIAGVMTKSIIIAKKNPNKWEKHMAPWFTAECKAAKQQYIRCRKTYGRASPPARQAFKDYSKCCTRSRAKLQLQLPDIIKYKPKQFWKMLKSNDHDLSALKLKDFTDHNRALFHDISIPEDEYIPITSPATQHITTAELTHTL